MGYTSEQVKEAYDELEPVPVIKVRRRQSDQSGLDMRVRTEAARILHERGINPEGSELDHNRLGRTNFIIMKSAIDRQVNEAVGHGADERHELIQYQLDQIDREFTAIVERAVQEVFNATD